MFCFSELLEHGKRLIPQFCKVIAEQREALGIQFINPPCPVAAVAHQAGILQHPQVLRNGRAGNRQAGGKLIHRLRMVAKHLENGQPGGVAQCGQPVLYVSIHLR